MTHIRFNEDLPELREMHQAMERADRAQHAAQEATERAPYEAEERAVRANHGEDPQLRAEEAIRAAGSRRPYGNELEFIIEEII